MTHEFKKNKKEIVVAVSGGFDPPHVGHVRLFQEAKKLGDKLVVILNNDYWLKEKKGYVFMSQYERKELISSFACVDDVVLTGHTQNPKDMSVCKELEKIKPHIFVNGGDRNKKNIPEVDTCNAINCKMVFNIGAGGKVQSSSWLLKDFGRKVILSKQASNLSKKKIIAFDLDGTLAESKTVLDKEMAKIIGNLLEKKIVAIISGGAYPQFEKQLLPNLKHTKSLENLFLLPTSGSSFYHFKNEKWQLVYENLLNKKEKEKIEKGFEEAFLKINYQHPKKVYGKTIEDRGSQFTFSAVGQGAPLEVKQNWNKTQDKRSQIQKILQQQLPKFEIRLGGLTSVDITKKGIDKGYAIEQIVKILKTNKDEIAFVGDAIYEGGNDHAVVRTGIETVEVSGPEETKYFIRSLLKQHSAIDLHS